MTIEIQSAASDLVLETERLRLRRFRREDVNAVFAIIGDDVVMQYYPKTFNRADAEQWIERNTRRYREDGYGLFAVTPKDSDDLIGDCGVIKQSVEGELAMEVGYHFRRDQWGHGYATEAARACMGIGVPNIRRWAGDLVDSSREYAVAARGRAKWHEAGAACDALRTAASGVCNEARGVRFTSGAKARHLTWAQAARLKPCPFKTDWARGLWASVKSKART